MQTRLSVFAAKLAEGGWLAALVIVPILFNLYTERIFEEDKIPLMRSLALLVGAALLVWGLERGRDALWVEGRPLWKIPIVPPALLLTGAYLLATAFSILPRVSFWGAYIRRQGTFTWLSYVTIFLAILLLVRHRRQVERIVTLILLTSVPPSLYAFLQNRGLDPIPWGGDVVQRVSSMAGNPIFISAYLIMVLPLTLMRVIQHFQRLVHADVEEERQDSLVSSLLAGAYLFLLIIQIVTIVFSQSRGPLLGLGVGLVFFGILFSLRYSRWLTLTIAGLAVAGIFFLLLFNVPNSPLEPLREVPYIGRLGQVFETESGTGRVRTLIWEGSATLLADDPSRLLTGYGPETMYVAFNPFYPPELGQIERRNASPDRSHNETFDSLVMTGVLGFAAQTALFLSIFFYALRWLGLIVTRRQQGLFFATAGVGGLLGALLPYAIEGTFRMSGVGLPAGIAVGLIVYLLTYALTHLKTTVHEAHPSHLLLITLLAAVIGHFVEIHFGIAIAATRLYFWVYAALIILLGMPLLAPAPGEAPATGEEPAEAERKRRRSKPRRATADAQGGVSGSLVGLSLMMSLILCVLTFDFYVPNVGLDMGRVLFPLSWLFLGTWIFGALVLSGEVYLEGAQGARQRRLGRYALISLGGWLAFCLLFVPWASSRPSIAGTISLEQLLAFGSQVANTISVLYLGTFALVLVTAVALLREEPLPHATSRPLGWQTGLYGVVALGLVPLIVVTNLNISRADIFNKQGGGYENRNLDAAIVYYEEALRLQPDEDRYFLNMGRTLLAKARAIQGDPSQREAFLQQARAILERAQLSNPLNTDHTRNLASLHRTWATLVSDPAEQAAHQAQADSYYAQAVALSPNNASMWNEWATLSIEREQWEEARDKLARSIELDDRFVTSYALLGNLEVDTEHYEAALVAYDAALALRADNLPALSGKALALSRLGRTEEAINVTRQALQIAPNDYATHKNLALLYQEVGEYEQALQAAQAALASASETERPAIEVFIQELTRQVQDSGG